MQLLSYLQTHQHFSRRNIVQWIKKGEIFVNNQKVESIRHSIEPGDSITKKNDRSITIEKVADIQKQILLFNKPKGYVVSKSDPHNTTIYELLPEKYKDYYYIGRLDKESRGLLLLTNTPEIIHLYEHPKFNKKKEYLIQLSSSMSLKDIQQAKH
jgi:23S rRNA pseudouridine2605 synthase